MQKIGDITNTATPEGEFTDGSVAGGVSPTLLPAEWFNTIQRELCNIVLESGGTLDPDNDKQILEAITKIAQGIIPDFTVVESSTDTTAGRILNVGYHGLGGLAPRTPAATDQNYDRIPTKLNSGFWTHAGPSGPYAHTITLLQDGGGVDNDRHFIIPSNSNGKIAVRWDESSGLTYQYFYTDKNKPTPAEIGALLSSQSTLTVDLNILGALTSDGVYYQTNNAGATSANHYPAQAAGTLLVTRSAYGCQQMYTTYSGRIFLRALTGNWTGSGPWSEWVEMYGPSNKPTPDIVNCIQRDGCHIGGFASGDAARPYMRHTVSNTVVELAKKGDSYTKSESDNGYAAKTSVYTKSESDGRYQPKGTYATPNTASKAASGWWQDTSTGMIYQWVEGAATTGTGNQTVTFPKTFPTACLFANVGTLNTANNDNAEQNFQLVSKSNASCVVKPNIAYGSSGSVAALVWAVGY